MTIRDARLEKRLSSREAATQCGIMPSRFSHIEHCYALATKAERAAITELLGDVEIPTHEDVQREQEIARKQGELIAEVNRRILANSGGKRSVQGQVECPSCGGQIRYSIASNGHKRVGCVNRCVGWIE